MTILDKIWITCFGLGMVLCFCSVIITNLAVQKMRGVLNSNRTPGDQLRWHDAIQFVGQSVIDMYRAAYPDGPFYRNLVIGYYTLGIGIVLMIGSALL
ncbi:MAG: hypothetical protein JSS95_01575 [Acidobacteria bacterium]|nr:hypothetical protein [Acidobacteriota bacterium]